MDQAERWTFDQAENFIEYLSESKSFKVWMNQSRTIKFEKITFSVRVILFQNGSSTMFFSTASLPTMMITFVHLYVFQLEYHCFTGFDFHIHTNLPNYKQK
jgi:hypothetical protein